MDATFWRREKLPLDTYRDLVKLLHTNVVALTICGLLQTALCAVIACRLTDIMSMEAAFVVAASEVARLAVVLASRAYFPDFADRPTVRTWEGRQAVAQLVNAAALGAMGVLTAFHDDGRAFFMFAAVAASFAMELIARTAGRPWICRYALALTFTPAILALLASPGLDHLAQAGVLLAFVVAPLELSRSIYDVLTSRMAATRSFANLAKVDPLTGLANRLALDAFLESSLARRSSDEMVALHCLDLDRFKEANDRYGHAVGDELLKAVAARLRRCSTPDDLVARLGGDEFVMVQTGLHRLYQARQMAQLVIQRLGEPFDLRELTIDVGVSVGIALASDSAQTNHTLLANADAALYAAKRGGRNRYVVADPQPARQDDAYPSSMAA